MQFVSQVAIESINGIAAIAVLLIVSFAIDRVVTGIMFARFMIPPLARDLPDLADVDDPDERRLVAKRFKLVYYTLTLIFATAVVAGPEWFNEDGEFGTGAGIRIVQPLLAQSLGEYVSAQEQEDRLEAARDEVAALSRVPENESEKAGATREGKLAEAEKRVRDLEKAKKEAGPASESEGAEPRQAEFVDKVVAAQVAPWLDMLITIIVLVGGADRIAAFARLPGSVHAGAGETTESRPVELTGRFAMVPDEEASKAEAGAGARKGAAKGEKA